MTDDTIPGSQRTPSGVRRPFDKRNAAISFDNRFFTPKTAQNTFCCHTTVLFNAEKHCATNWKEAEECPQASRTVKSYYSKKRFSAYSNLQHASREFVKLKQ